MVAIVKSALAFREACDKARARGCRVGLVPTMGALHEGHLSLVREAKRLADWVAVSIFVNPTQFGPTEDFGRYPRDLEGDTRKVSAAGADLVFAPDVEVLYPAREETRVRVGRSAEPLCGPFRPGHFEGVTTVVAKLFALLGPGIATFGRKDYQQLVVLRRMAEDLFLPVELVGCPIVREADGLAMSSRNAYLQPKEREEARCLALGLSRAAKAFEGGERHAARLVSLAREEVAKVTSAIDYVEACDPDTLEPQREGLVGERALLAIACRLGKTRLIDNVVLGEDRSPI